MKEDCSLRVEKLWSGFIEKNNLPRVLDFVEQILREGKPNAHNIVNIIDSAIGAYLRSQNAVLKAVMLCMEISPNQKADFLRIRAEMEATLTEAVEGKPEALPFLPKLTKALNANSRAIFAEIKASCTR